MDALYNENRRPVPFWIDTLCVPLEPEFRRLAIRLMKSVYQEVDKVLVLDNLLLSNPISSNPTEDLMRIRSTRWLQRLWTFQEGILASSLYFQFQNGVVLGESLIAQMEQLQKEIYLKYYNAVDLIFQERVPPSKRLLVEVRNFVDNLYAPLWLDEKNPWLGRHSQVHDLVSYKGRNSLRRLRFLILDTPELWSRENMRRCLN